MYVYDYMDWQFNVLRKIWIAEKGQDWLPTVPANSRDNENDTLQQRWLKDDLVYIDGPMYRWTENGKAKMRESWGDRYDY